MNLLPAATSLASESTLLKAYRLMRTAEAMTHLYEIRKEVCSKYVHATSRGHEAIQLAVGLQLRVQDFVSPYYRDDALLLGIGLPPYSMMLQLLAKKDDPFSAGRSYYAHPSLNQPDYPKILHQSSATGMQAIPATGVAQGLKYRASQGLDVWAPGEEPLVVCSLGDGSVTEGEVAEALQMAALHQLPVLFLVQDNQWGISATGHELYAQDAAAYAAGFKGIEALSVDGTDFVASYQAVNAIFAAIREERRPFLLRATTVLLNHHTSGVRKEWYRDDLDEQSTRDPIIHLHRHLLAIGTEEEVLLRSQEAAWKLASEDLDRALEAPDPQPEDLFAFQFAPTPVVEEAGTRSPAGAQEVVMVDAALHAVVQILQEFPEAMLYGQDVGQKLGGVFREAATLSDKFGIKRVFNTPIQEAYIVGSTVGMSATGCKPMVEVQFADYLWPAMNQLFAEVSRSYYLSAGKWPVQAVIRVPIGAYGSGGPFHSSSIESVVLQIRGLKVVYPSNAADMKGLFRAAFLDPNPVIMFEHKGLYWSKVPGSKAARNLEPSDDYVVPLGKARIFQHAAEEQIALGNSCLVIAYGMGVHWALEASQHLAGRIEILDLRTLAPLDWEAIKSSVARHGKALVLTEEVLANSFAEALAGRISRHCFEYLDAPVFTLGALEIPAIPLNQVLEQTMLPGSEKVRIELEKLLNW